MFQGTGLGLLGISVSHLSPAHVTLTDLPAITARLPAALALNRLSPPVSTLDLDWTSFSPSHPLALLQSDPATRLDVLVASDVLWLPHLVPPLLRVLDVLLPSPSQIFILGYQERSSRVTDVFFTGLAERGFEWKAIDWERYLEGWHRPGVAIYEVRRKAD